MENAGVLAGVEAGCSSAPRPRRRVSTPAPSSPWTSPIRQLMLVLLLKLLLQTPITTHIKFSSDIKDKGRFHLKTDNGFCFLVSNIMIKVW